MRIETKYNLGEEVWTIDNCKAIKFTIISIHPSIDESGIYISYWEKGAKMHDEEHCYPTKESLIASL